ncbi:MAG TPA: HhH-GPD-type base excision DNA repair protein [Gaiellaceae bacterium]|nr:HhH-GPD-type base excision DNA repair protein [Gaiellaceae bacterium]
MAKAPGRLYFTDEDEACRLLAEDPFALLVGFALDQQITVQQAFAGPLRLKQRLGTLDPGAIAATDPARLEALFREKPAIHRFPGAMATRVQDLAAAVASDYDGRAERIWTEATGTADLGRRIGALPGFGEMKVKALGSVLARRFGVAAAEALLPDHRMLGDVDSPQALIDYQAAKRAHKASLRAAKAAAS